MTYQELLHRYLRKHKTLVQPRQGWTSLEEGLWLAYSLGRVRGFTDLGTYVNKPGDHGWDDVHRTALAFDLGREDRFFFKGWGYLKARRLAKLYWKHHLALNINYVILGHKIISREKPYWHPFTRDDSHMFHIHVSGVEPI